MNINEKTFCVVPFAQLNTRGKGDPRICCSIAGIEYGIPKHLTVDQINDETYTPQTEVFNLAEDSIDDLWNSPFMKDFRMRQMNGERLSNCAYCYKNEDSGLTSKRLTKNKRFLEDTRPLLQEYYDKMGHVDKMPQWWEIRLSTKCNLACIMCSPNLSSMMFKEYEKWGDEATPEMRGSLEIAKNSGGEYLSKSQFFRQQVIDNLQYVSFMEFRGGEVFADKHSIDFIREIAETEYAKQIKLDISTNGTLISESIIDLLNKFQGGLLRFALDGPPEKDELIRYHTKFEEVHKGMKNSLNLHSHWKRLTQTTIQNNNCMFMYDLMVWIDNWCRENNDNSLYLGYGSVRGKPHLRHEMVPLEMRLQEIDKLIALKKTMWLVNESNDKEEHSRTYDRLIQVLRNEDTRSTVLRDKAVNFYQTLSKLRGVDYFAAFPHLEHLNGD
jgi:MoaA/NifB/PqqE/SkfB family radical SAM enzyme